MSNPRAVALAAILAASTYALAQPAFAGTISISHDTATYSGAYGGGENGVALYSGGPGVPSQGPGVQVSGSAFQTFCVETTQFIQTNRVYDFSIAAAAVSGGYSGRDGTTDGLPSDSLDARTAYLYSRFWNGTLSNYVYVQGSGRTSSATSLQLAIWHLEDEIQPGTLTDAYAADAQAQAWVAESDAAVAPGGAWSGHGIGDVRIMNLTDSAGTDVQSLLVEVVPIPEPPAAGVGAVFLAGVALVALRRRRARTAAAV